MQPSDQDHRQPDETPAFDPWFEVPRPPGEPAASEPQPQEFRTRTASNAGATHSSLRAASTTLEDALSRLEHIRITLQDLEGQGLITNRTRASSAQHSSRTAPENNIGPSHSAIIFSDGDDSLSTLDPEALRNRLDELGATLPQYIRSAASIIRNITRRTTGHSQDARVDNQVSPLRQAAEGLTSGWYRPTITLRQAADLPTSRSHTPNSQTSNAASGRFIRPRRNSNPFIEGITVYRRQESNRDSDPASTSLGRRVASRTAARSSEGTPTDQRLRASGSSRSTLSEHLYPPRAASGSTSTSRTLFRTRLSRGPSRRVSQLELDALERVRSQYEDSDGSETEVDDPIGRPIIIASDSEDSGGGSGERPWSESSEPPLPNLLPGSPLSSPEMASSIGPSNTVSSSRPVADERRAMTTSRLREVQERLDRISNALSNVPRDWHISAFLARGGLDSDAYAYPDPNADEFAAGENTYRDVVDEDEGRTYRIRRRINANGEEQVHHIRTDDWWTGGDEFDSAFLSRPSAIAGGRRSAAERLPDGVVWGQYPPPQVINEPSVPGASSGSGTETGRFSRRIDLLHGRQNRPAEMDPTSHNAQLAPPSITATRRRRGWARLNADGDEIPTDEEEEIERARTEQRLRISRTIFNSSFPGSARARMEYLAPTTRSVFTYGTEDGEDGGSTAHIRLNLPAGQTHRRVQQLARDGLAVGKDKEQETEQESFGTSEPYYLCPLPVPLEQMDSVRVPARQHSSRAMGLIASRESEMAAR